jgi:hypothetical protein
MRRLAVAAVVLICGSGLAACSGHSSHASRRSATTPTTPEQSAHAVARTMLDAVTVPRDAQLYKGRLPAVLTSATAGVPAVQNLVTEYRTWSVPVPSKSLRSFVFTTRRHGFDGGTNASGSMTTSAGRAWIGMSGYSKLPLNVALAQLDIGVADDGRGGSVIRADALVSWTPPKTAAELVPAADDVAVVTVMSAAAPPVVVRHVVVTDPKEYAAIVAAFDRMRLAVLVRFGECGLLNVVVPGFGAYGKGTIITSVVFSRDRGATPDLQVWTPTCRGVGARSNGRLQPTLQSDDNFWRIVRSAVLAAA